MSLGYDVTHPLFIAPDTRLRIDEASKALELCYSSGKPVLIYIHGRAKGIGEPKKSVQSGIYKELADYGVTVLGFTWDADDGGFDDNRPIASCDDFARLLSALRDFQSAHGAPKPALLAHSMGNIIVAELAKDEFLGADRGDLLSNLVLTSAAVKTKRHAKWLDRIGIAERIYVAINDHDAVLGFAGVAFKPDMLGRDLRAPGASSARVTYVDVSACDVNHRYFVPQGQKGHAKLAAFYRQAVLGQAVDFSALAAAGAIDGVAVQRIAG